MRFEEYSYRFAEQVLNSKLRIKNEIESIISSIDINSINLSRPELNKEFENRFIEKGWESQPQVIKNEKGISAKLDFFKDRVGIEVQLGHSSFIGIDLLKFQTMSYSNLDEIDIGVYIVATNTFKRKMIRDFKQKWGGSLTFEKVKKYLPHFRSAIQVPIFVYGIDL